MEVPETIMNRRIMGKYKSEPVPKEIIGKLIEAASHAPTTHNLQPWQFIISRDEERRKQIASITDLW